jgi:hypothetical protein
MLYLLQKKRNDLGILKIRHEIYLNLKMNNAYVYQIIITISYIV